MNVVNFGLVHFTLPQTGSPPGRDLKQARYVLPHPKVPRYLQPVSVTCMYALSVKSPPFFSKRNITVQQTSLSFYRSLQHPSRLSASPKKISLFLLLLEYF